jgi:hypothetical protein
MISRNYVLPHPMSPCLSGNNDNLTMAHCVTQCKRQAHVSADGQTSHCKLVILIHTDDDMRGKGRLCIRTSLPHARTNNTTACTFKCGNAYLCAETNRTSFASPLLHVHQVRVGGRANNSYLVWARPAGLRLRTPLSRPSQPPTRDLGRGWESAAIHCLLTFNKVGSTCLRGHLFGLFDLTSNYSE